MMGAHTFDDAPCRPTDWFQLNPSFGYETDLQNLLTKTNSMGMACMGT